MPVYCYDLVRTKSVFWTKTRDDFLREHYNAKIKVEPAMLAMSLGLAEVRVINRLAELGLRNRRAQRNMQLRRIV
jgi:hypothetical protein